MASHNSQNRNCHGGKFNISIFFSWIRTFSSKKNTPANEPFSVFRNINLLGQVVSFCSSPLRQAVSPSLSLSLSLCLSSCFSSSSPHLSFQENTSPCHFPFLHFPPRSPLFWEVKHPSTSIYTLLFPFSFLSVFSSLFHSVLTLCHSWQFLSFSVW